MPGAIKLGIVGDCYKVVQNRDMAQFCQDLAEMNDVVKVESAGSIRGGKKILFLLKGESFTVRSSDHIEPYICVSNGHDGGTAIRATPTSVRVVCANTLMLVIPDNERASSPRIVTREIEDNDKECLRFGRVFHEAVLEPRTSITRDNVMTETLGIFRVCGTPTRESDVTNDDWSQSWFQEIPEPGVVRRFSKWGELHGGRTWLLNPERTGQFQTGFCAYADMLGDGDHFRSIRSDVLSKTGSRSGQDWKVFVNSVPDGMVTYKSAEWFDMTIRTIQTATAAIFP